jgi:serine/threonine-protein kinase
MIPDDILARTATQMGFVTREQIAEARRAQQAMSDMKVQASLQEIMQRNGMLTPAQINAIRRSAGAAPVEVPGYEILNKIGAGGMGTVYKARQRSVDRIVAIKILSSTLTGDSAFVARFMNEARTAARLNHPNIISVFDAGEASGLYYLVMEYAEGAPLDRVLQNSGPLAESRVRDIGIQIGHALSSIEKHRMLHRDIKPNNILIDRRGSIKLCDFGLARLQEPGTTVTRSGEVLGTPMYMSPEQINAEKDIDIRSDLYSVGATLFCLLTGRPPFQGDSAMAVALQHVSAPPPDPRSIRPSISPAISSVVLRLLEKDRSQRIQSPEEMVAALKSAAVMPTLRRVREGRKRRVALAAAGLALVALFVAVAMWPGDNPRPAAAAPPPPAAPPPKAAPPPPPKVDREKEARALLEEGWDYARSEDPRRWDRARKIAGILESQYRDVSNLDVAGLTERVIENERALREKRLFEQAEKRFGEGDWHNALLHYQQLQATEAVEERIRACRAELSAGRSVEDLLRIESDGRWRDLRRKLDQVPPALKETATWKSREREVEDLSRRVDREAEAFAVLGRVRGAAGASNWESFDRLLKEYEKYADTRTYGWSIHEVQELALGKEASAQRANERRAEMRWNRAELAMREGRFEEGQEQLKQFLADDVGTEIYKARAEEAKGKLQECEAAIAQAWENRAAELVAETRKLKNSADWVRLDAVLQELAGYDGSAATKSAEKFLKDARRQCEKELAKMRVLVLREDFEKGTGGWAGYNDRGKPPQVAEGKDFREGKRALHVSFSRVAPEQEDDAGGVAALAVDGLDADSSEVRFWAKLLGAEGNIASTDLIVILGEGREGQLYEIHSATVRLARGWKEYTLTMADFTCIANNGGNGTLEPARVGSIGFMNADRLRAAVVGIDDFRIFKPPK